MRFFQRMIVAGIVGGLAACGGSDSSNTSPGNTPNSPTSGFSFTPKGDEARGAEDFALNQQTGIDQQSHVDWTSRTAPYIAPYFEDPNNREIYHDPYRMTWADEGRGSFLATTFTNRYGAQLAAELYGPPQDYTDPVTGEVDAGPYPVVLLIPGYAADTWLFAAYSQQLAENGYIVVAVTPQGQIPSETEPNPMEVYCDPEGDWKQPQEAGVQEQGDCAGYDSTPEQSPVSVGSPMNLAGGEEVQAWMDETAEVYQAHFRPRYGFAAFDAADWLASGQAPWSERMDISRLGIVGHSAGTAASLDMANLDPEKRFDVAIVMDGYSRPAPEIKLHVPTMIQYSEQQAGYGPYPVDWDPLIHTPVVNSLHLLEDGVPMMSIGLRASSHFEWHYVPYRLMNPVAPFSNTSALGNQLGHYYNLAWLDYHLKGNSEAHKADAERRLLARTFDDSADRTNISTGTYDPATNGNNPYLIEGEAVEDHISVWFPNIVSFGGHFCFDWHDGCADTE